MHHPDSDSENIVPSTSTQTSGKVGSMRRQQHVEAVAQKHRRQHSGCREGGSVVAGNDIRRCELRDNGGGALRLPRSEHDAAPRAREHRGKTHAHVAAAENAEIRRDIARDP